MIKFTEICSLNLMSVIYLLNLFKNDRFKSRKIKLDMKKILEITKNLQTQKKSNTTQYNKL